MLNHWCLATYTDGKVYRANMGPIWGRQDPDGPHVGHMNFANWVSMRLLTVQPLVQLIACSAHAIN